jgi:hypothetical protein
MEVIAHGIPFIEIPVNYRRRVGESSVTGDLWKAFWLGLRMITLVLGYRFGMQRAARVLWTDTGRRQSYEFPSDLLALAERTSGDRDKPVEVTHAVTKNSK